MRAGAAGGLQQMLVQVGQRVTSGTILAKVAQPQNGTVTVDATLTGPLPLGARPDLSVNGVIELERMEDIVYVERPAFGHAGSTVGLFRLEPDGKGAVRVQVKLGRASVNNRGARRLESGRPGDPLRYLGLGRL